MSSSNIFDEIFNGNQRRTGYRLTVNGMIVGEFRTLGDAYKRIDKISPIGKVLTKNYFVFLWTKNIVAVEINDQRNGVHISYRLEKLQ